MYHLHAFDEDGRNSLVMSNEGRQLVTCNDGWLDKAAPALARLACSPARQSSTW